MIIRHRVPENRVRAVAEKANIDFNREEEFEVRILDYLRWWHKFCRRTDNPDYTSNQK